MLELAWAELSEVSKRIEHLQAQRSGARRTENFGRVKSLGDEIDRAISERERVVVRIASLMKAGALDEPEAGYRRAA